MNMYRPPEFSIERPDMPPDLCGLVGCCHPYEHDGPCDLGPCVHLAAHAGPCSWERT